MLLYSRYPNLILVPIDNDYYSVVNTDVSGSFSVINGVQANTLLCINRKVSLEDVAQKTNYPLNDIKTVARILEKNKLICRNGIKINNTKNKISKRSHYKSLNFWIHTTNSCNLSCTYCYIDKSNVHMNAKTIQAVRRKILETVRAYNIKNVTFRLAGGEPTLKFHLWKDEIKTTIKELKAIGCKSKFVFLTNLVQVSDELIEFSKKHNIGFSVSLDGTREYHNRTRVNCSGKGSFDDVLSNIRRLQHAGISPFFNVVISNENVEGLVEFTEFLVKEKFGARYSFVHHGTNALNVDKLTSVLDKCYTVFESEIDKGYPFSKKHKLCDLKFQSFSTSACSAGRNNAAIASNGDIQFCQLSVNNNQALGSVFSKEDLFTIIQRQIDIHNNYSVECRECIFFKVCLSGCPQGRINGKSPYCEVYKKYIPRVFQLIGKEMLYRINTYTA